MGQADENKREIGVGQMDEMRKRCFWGVSDRKNEKDDWDGLNR